MELHIILYQPEIPQNTGNIARLCAATKIQLHLIEPLGFSLEDRYLKRAGLDYWEYVSLKTWPNLETYLNSDGHGRRLIMASARGGLPVHTVPYRKYDSIVFGRETAGLPMEVLEHASYKVRIPIYTEVRSLNLATAVGIIVYQALICTGEITNIP